MDRYKRNIQIEGFGEEGQQKLKAAKVLVVGAGGLGSPVLYYLAAAGIGTIGIIDYDVVDLSNLQRQIIHQIVDIGQQKAKSAKAKLLALNPEIIVNMYAERFTEENAGTIIGQYDFIVDCCDNYDTKFLINDICVEEQKPYSHGAILALRGEVMTYLPGCCNYRDIFDGPPENKSELDPVQAGTLGAVAGVVGSIQATEVIKYFTGIGELIINRILIFDGKAMSFHSLKV
jgi:molybdopterin/thiamine biosynthesis adenylyltransferase